MIRRCDFQVATIHDAYFCHPNNYKAMLQMYREVLADLARSNLLQDILTELAGYPITITKDGDALAELILKSEYALS
ncbi:MAG: hypothetical protein PF440_01460 [Thiomicrorhabdus sp.]|jgi:DNA-directed RNA polymerase|nr:hypothetical protein [Thiomicrorhabdus sp.]